MIRGHEPFAIRRQIEVSWITSSRERLVDRGEFPRGVVESEDRDAVMPAVGAVDESAVGMHPNLRGGIIAGEVGGQGRLSVSFGQCASSCVVVVACECAVELIDHEDVAPIRAKSGMPRTGSRCGGDERCRGGCQRGGACVESVGKDFVESKVAHDDEAIIRRDI